MAWASEGVPERGAFQLTQCGWSGMRWGVVRGSWLEEAKSELKSECEWGRGGGEVWDTCQTEGSAFINLGLRPGHWGLGCHARSKKFGLCPAGRGFNQGMTYFCFRKSTLGASLGVGGPAAYVVRGAGAGEVERS